MFSVTGYNYASYWHNQFAKSASFASLKNLADTGATSVAISFTAYTKNLTSSGMIANDMTEPDASITQAIQDARSLGLDVILKPLLDPDSGGWRGLFKPANAATWFSAYKTWMVGKAQLAQAAGAETLVIGTELDSLVGEAYRAKWLDIISAIRAVFEGDLTYAAVLEKSSTVSFWDALDFASVTVYPEATSSAAAMSGQVLESWASGYAGEDSVLQKLTDLHTTSGKDVLIAEAGYRNLDGALLDPGSFSGKGLQDAGEQLDAYRGMMTALSSFNDTSWFKGVQLWSWSPVTKPSEEYTDAEAYNGYSVQETAALEDVTAWFKGTFSPDYVLIQGSQSVPALEGSEQADMIVIGEGPHTVLAGGGDDRIVLGPESNWVDGGSGANTVSCLSAYQSVTLQLGDGSAGGSVKGFDEEQTLVRIQHVQGSQFKDTLTGNAEGNSMWGDAGNDVIRGGGGNDTLVGGAGADSITGGSGTDTASYADALGAVQVSLATGKSSGKLGVDVLKEIENLVGGSYADTLTGNALANKLAGGLGKDSLTGSAGADIFLFDTAPSLANVDTIKDFVSKTDKVALSTAIFTGLTWRNGSLETGQLATFEKSVGVLTSESRLIYLKQSGQLYYDADGSGTGEKVIVAVIGTSTHPSLVLSDFLAG